MGFFVVYMSEHPRNERHANVSKENLMHILESPGTYKNHNQRTIECQMFRRAMHSVATGISA